MAFATANIARQNIGSANRLTGTWTGTVGDAVGTMTGSGYVLNAEFDSNTSTGPGETLTPRLSNSSGTWTVTIPYSQTVTAGTFNIDFK